MHSRLCLTLWYKPNSLCCLHMKSVLKIFGYFLEQFHRFSRGWIYPKMFSTDFIFRQQENLVDNQKCQARFRPLCNKILFPLIAVRARRSFDQSQQFNVALTYNLFFLNQIFGKVEIIRLIGILLKKQTASEFCRSKKQSYCLFQ